MKEKLYLMFAGVSMALLMAGCYVNEFDDTIEEIDDKNNMDVNIDELKQDIKHFLTDITPIATNCNSAIEMEVHLNEIKKMEGVKNAWVEEDAFFIEDNQGFIHLWDYQDETIEDDVTENNYTRLMQTSKTTYTHTNTDSLKACLIMTNDPGVYRQKDKEYLSELLKKHHYKVTFVSGKDLTPDYFVKEEYKSEEGKHCKLESFSMHDLYIFRVHGHYDYNDRTHWLSTDMTLMNTDLAPEELDRKFYKSYPWLKAKAANGKKAIGFLYNEEIPFYTVNVMISEDFFNDYCNNFTKKPIILSSTCQSMADNINLASTFVDILGAGVFLGMTAINSHGRFSIMRILQLMLEYNYSFQGALNALTRFSIKYKSLKTQIIHTELGITSIDWLPRDFDCVLNPHAPIDMGTSVKWARWNIGTNNIFELGDSLRWAETKPWSLYQYNAYNDYPEFSIIPDNYNHYGQGWPDIKYALDYIYPGYNIGGNPTFDAATANWGREWRLPTKKEFEELLDDSKFNIERITDTTPNYLRITSKTEPSKTIVFPFPDISWFSLSSYVCPYWSSDYYECVNDKGENELEAWALLLAGTFPIMSDCPGYYAGYARGVQPK